MPGGAGSSGANHVNAQSRMSGDTVVVSESGNGPYAQLITAGRHRMNADEPETLGGQDSGPSPYQYLMAGLGACTAMTIRGYAVRHTWSVGKITVRLRHDRTAAADGKKTDRFDREIEIAGALTAEQKNRLLAIAEACPVSKTLQQPSLVVSRLISAGQSRGAVELA